MRYSFFLVTLCLLVGCAFRGVSTEEAEEVRRSGRQQLVENDSTLSFELRDGDRVVFLGSGLIERMQEFGYVELALTTRWPDRDIIFRNLGWAGDTPYGEARGHYTNPPEPYEHLLQQVKAVEPTVIFIGYGTVASFKGGDAIPRFVEGLNRLMDDLSETGARVVLLSPAPYEAVSSPRRGSGRHNQNLERVTQAIRQIAIEHRCSFVNLFAGLQHIGDQTDARLTTNGIYLSPAGYFYAASVLEADLGLPSRAWAVRVRAGEGHIEADGAAVSEAKLTRDSVQFVLKAPLLPVPSPAAVAEASSPLAYERVLSVAGLRTGRYSLLTDGRPVVTASAKQWSKGVRLFSGPAVKQANRLRSAIIEKNQLYFYQFRPPNRIYLTGFREYEQGQYADDLARFDSSVVQKEHVIGQLRVSTHHTYKLVPVEKTRP